MVSMKNIFYFILFLLPSLEILATTEFFVGMAKTRSGEHAYTEHHVMTYDGDRLIKVETTYFTPEQKKFASLVSSFTSSQLLPDSEFTDNRTNKKEITAVAKDNYILTTIDEKSISKSEKLKITDNMLCGQGYHNYLRNNLTNFKLNEIKEIKFVLPSKRDYYSFDLSLIKITDERKTFKLAITNFILKMFADSIEVDYANDGTLLEYRGLSNIQDSDGNNMDVIITLNKVDKLP